MPTSFRGRLLVNGLRIFWVLITVWCEYAIFFYKAQQCQWPDKNLQSAASHASHVLVISDPQIIDSQSYPGRGAFLTYLTQVFADLNLRKNWRAALAKKPDAAVFLGDMMDGGRRAMSDEEYEIYYERFKSIFASDIPTYYIPGNHDTGLGSPSAYSSSPQARSRYISHFGSLNQAVPLAGHTLVLLDAPGLVDEESKRQGSGLSFNEWKPAHGGTIDFVKSFETTREQQQPLILFNHIPLSRPADTDCGPLRERGTIRQGRGLGYQNTLGQDTSSWLLENLRPGLIFSGDDHDYCEYNHYMKFDGQPASFTREVTLKSISMVMGIRRPGFQLLSLAPPTGSEKSFSDSPCLMPDQLGIYLSVYIPCLVISLLAIVVSHIAPSARAGSLRPLSVDLSPMPLTSRSRRKHHARFDTERGGQVRQKHISDSDLEEELLPLPGSSRSATGGASVRATRHPTFLCQRRTTKRGLVFYMVRDVRDVAVLPLGLFAVISWWTFR